MPKALLKICQAANLRLTPIWKQPAKTALAAGTGSNP